MTEPERIDVDRSGIFPNGYGCSQCDGTGFVSDEDLDELERRGTPIRDIIAANLALATLETPE